MQSSLDRLGKFLFLLVSFFVVWQLNIKTKLEEVATALGAAQTGFLRWMIVSLGVPFTLTVIALFSVWFYQKVIWRFLSGSNYRGGWWIYALVSEHGARRANSVGFFRIEHTHDNTRVPEAQAYYVRPDGFEPPRSWRADTVWNNPNQLRLVFTMRAIAPPQDVLPSHYDGFMELEPTSGQPLVGSRVWRGYFNDLKDRHHVFGPVYAERLKWHFRQNSDKLKILLQGYATGLLERAHF